MPVSTWLAPLPSVSQDDLASNVILERLRGRGITCEFKHEEWMLDGTFVLSLNAVDGVHRKSLTVVLDPNAVPEHLFKIKWPGLTREQLKRGRDSRLLVRVQAPIEQDGAATLHLQFKALAALVVDAAFVVDNDTQTLYPWQWLSKHADAPSGPSPADLVSIHDVYASVDGLHWLHTHGMDRGEKAEIDIVDVPAEEVLAMQDLMRTAIAKFFDQDLAAPEGTFQLIPGVPLRFVHWEQAINRHVIRGLGGRADRQDGVHAGHRGLLFTPNGESPVVYAGAFADPQDGSEIVHMGQTETAAIRSRAMDTWPLFRQLFDTYYGAPALTFMAKLSFPEPSGTNHYWFSVSDFGEDWLEATRTMLPALPICEFGKPYEFPLDRLTDWAIAYGARLYTSDEGEKLERHLQRDGVPRDDDDD